MELWARLNGDAPRGVKCGGRLCGMRTSRTSGLG
jgi:hypothetical protein